MAGKNAAASIILGTLLSTCFVGNPHYKPVCVLHERRPCSDVNFCVGMQVCKDDETGWGECCEVDGGSGFCPLCEGVDAGNVDLGDSADDIVSDAATDADTE